VVHAREVEAGRFRRLLCLTVEFAAGLEASCVWRT
jgi:hypothetical protein